VSAIGGIISLKQTPVGIEDFNPVMKALSHLGPDGSGVWREGPCALGHQMFRITPESLQEPLPFFDPGSDLAITADARLDNREELCDALDLSPDEGRELPDSHLIMKAFQKWGEDCVCQLLGDFVFALWDQRKGRMILVTDHMGRSPVYYYQDNARFVFATEIKGLLAAPQVRTRLDMEKLAMEAVPGLAFLDKARTFFEGIKRAPAATIISVREGGSHRGFIGNRKSRNRSTSGVRTNLQRPFRTCSAGQSGCACGALFRWPPSFRAASTPRRQRAWPLLS